MKKNFTLFAIALGLFCSSAIANASYKDVPDDSPYKEGVDYLELTGALDGGLFFHPNAKVSKAEFYKVLFTLFQDERPNGITSFDDVPTDAWFAPYAHLALSNQLETAAHFGPADNMTKIEAMQKLLEAYGVTGGIVQWNNRTRLFSDVPVMHPDYSLIARLVDDGILVADPTTALNPYQEISRGDFANLMLDFEKWQIHQEQIDQSHFYKSDIFADIWNQIMNNYYLPSDQEINPDALFNAAVKGMLSSLNDPFTVYFTPDQSNEFTTALSGNFEGIGAYINQDETTGNYFFSGFVENSPASTSGLKSGDVITAIDGVSTTDLSITDVINRIKGPAGTTVTVTIDRSGNSLSFTLTRAAVQITTTSGKIVAQNSWYIKIDVFGSTTSQDYVDTVAALKKEVSKPKAIVLDLRSNGGGYITAAAQIAGDYVPRLTKLVTLDYGTAQESITNSEDGIFIGIPLYILVNENTASASEILTQDLKEDDKAVVIGTQTYGKGSAQTLTQYWDGSELKITIAHWLSTNGTSINGVGVTPNVTIQGDAKDGQDLWLDAAEKAIGRL